MCHYLEYEFLLLPKKLEIFVNPSRMHRICVVVLLLTRSESALAELVLQGLSSIFMFSFSICVIMQVYGR